MAKVQVHVIEGVGLNVEATITNVEGTLTFRSPQGVSTSFTFYRFTVRKELLRWWNYIKTHKFSSGLETSIPPHNVCVGHVEGEYVFLTVDFPDPFRESRDCYETESGYYSSMKGLVLKSDLDRLISILVQHTP